ncbi:MAG TPA: hypothetical protein VFS11_00225 [Gemmatimonadales bacterium]|nr:hypothetical protein [Gemmatimonadales bacterium]
MPDLLYVRDPLTVQLFEAWGMAAEHGAWRSRWSEPTGTVTMGGSYFAEWQKLRSAGWLIQAELFVPTYSSGGASYVRALPLAADGSAGSRSEAPDEIKTPGARPGVDAS